MLIAVAGFSFPPLSSLSALLELAFPLDLCFSLALLLLVGFLLGAMVGWERGVDDERC